MFGWQDGTHSGVRALARWAISGEAPIRAVALVGRHAGSHTHDHRQAHQHGLAKILELRGGACWAARAGARRSWAAGDTVALFGHQAGESPVAGQLHVRISPYPGLSAPPPAQYRLGEL